MGSKDNLRKISVKVPPVAECSAESPIDEDTGFHPAHPCAAGPEEEETPPSSNLDEKSAKSGFDEKVVKKTVHGINTVLERDQKELAFAIGKLLNENYEAEKTRLGRKRLSKRQWAQALKDAGCKAGVSTMLQSGQLDKQNKILSEEDTRGLSKTHLVVLLGEKDREKKIQFARDARKNGWSSNVLLEKIQAAPTEHTHLPRKCVVDVSQRYAAILHLAEDGLKSVRLGIRDVSNVKVLSAVTMPASRAQALLAEMDAAQKALEPVYVKLRELAAAA